MLKKYLIAAATVVSIAFSSAVSAGTQVKMTTSAGELIIELEDEKAPLTTANFISYVESGFYDGTIFHRIIPGFVIQGGGFTSDMERRTTQDPVQNEADNELKNTRYSLSMARTSDPNSATSQFFINLVDNASLDHTGKDQRGWGYAVFGRVISGQDIVDEIAKTDTGSKSGMRDVPLEPVLIETATVLAK